jgi:choline dehydrogenase-like flavoprotein
MSADAALGVTDGYGRLWGTQNVFIASSAIFPTSGQANPTLTMVALAVRQAEYIAGIFHNKTCDA